MDALVLSGEEANERDQQRRGVERIGLVVLAEDAALRDALGEDVGADLVGFRLPLLGQPRLALELGEPRAAVRATQHISFDET